MRNTEYDVAFSFAGEDRAYVEMVAEQLTARQISVFYDSYEEVDMWGKDLYDHLVEVYRNRAQYTLMFLSKHYGDKAWPTLERRTAQSRALEQIEKEYILLARFDDTEIPGVLPTTFYLDLRRKSPVNIAIAVMKKLGKNPLATKADVVPSPKNSAMQGEARFNYSNHNGRFRIGEGNLEFETRWSKASNASIHCYTDGGSVRGVALAPKGVSVNAIPDAKTLDFSSRVRSPEINRFVIVQNHNGIYAALQILDIWDDKRGKDEDMLHFGYWILEDGTSDFSGVQPNR